MGGIVSQPRDGSADDLKLRNPMSRKSKRHSSINMENPQVYMMIINFMRNHGNLALVDSEKIRRFIREVYEGKIEVNAANDMSAVHAYVFPPGTKALVSKYLLNRKPTLGKSDGDSKVEEDVEILYHAFLISSMYPHFLGSEKFKTYLDKKESKGDFSSYTSEDSYEVNETSDKIDCSDDESFGFNSKIIYKLLTTKRWTEIVHEFIDNYPICITIANAKKKGFPLIYVNKAFLKTTGYDKEEILYTNCRFLQSERTESEQIYRMQEALRNSQPIKVGVTNVRRDGSEFFNMLAMHPVFNIKGDYTHVIAVQYDIINSVACAADVKRVDDILSIVSNVMM